MPDHSRPEPRSVLSFFQWGGMPYRNAMIKSGNPSQQTVEREFNGKVYSGSYQVHSDHVRVTTQFDCQEMRVPPGSNPKDIAGTVLFQILTSAQKEGLI
jgi:hypothetical protein